MKLDPILSRATRLTRRGKYGEAIQALETEVVRYHDSFRYYYILGTACLRVGDLGGALTYFKRAREIKMRDPSVLLGLAVLFLRRGETDRALDLYLEVQELDPHNRIVKKGLGVIRKYGGSETISTWVDSGNLSTLFPPLPELPFSLDRLLLPLLCLVLGLSLAGGVFVVIRGLPGAQTVSPRSGLSDSALGTDERNQPVQTGGSFRYILTAREVLNTYEEARSRFTEFRDEPAKVALNRLIESNASEAIKNKARLLKDFTDVPGFDTLKDRFEYRDVMTDTALYRDCHVIWRGMAANLESLENSTSFELLVGYDTRSSLQGIVPVVFNVSVPVNTERPLEVLGRIIPVSGPAGEDIRLEGVAIYQSGLLDSPSGR